MKPHIIVIAVLVTTILLETIYIYKLIKPKASEVNLPKITHRINTVIFFIACILLAIAIVFDINYFKYKPPINYSKWEEIEWSDFRAIKRPKQTLDGNKNFAFICTEIECKFKEDNLEINTLFHPSRSYTFSEELAGKDLLEHELYHLHITEYWSRLLRKEVLSFKNKANLFETLEEAVEEFRQKERQMQFLYDEESYHGYILGEQRNWQRKIDSCLFDLKNYSNPIINLKN